MNIKKVYIIIVNYNGWKDTAECLKSLESLDYPCFQIIIVDNASTDDSIDNLKGWGDKSNVFDIVTLDTNQVRNTRQENNTMLLIQAGTNLGFAGGNNLGIRFALACEDAEFVWLLNNDTIVERSSLTNLVSYALQYPKKIGITGSKIMEYYDRTIMQAAGGGTFIAPLGHSSLIGLGQTDIGQYNKSVNLKYVHGASMLVSIDFIKDIGLMNEDYFLYFEELDWSERGKRKGWGLGYAFQSIIFHKGGASTTNGTSGFYTKNSSTRFSDFYFHRSKILFTIKFYRLYLPTVYLSFLVTIINRLRRKQFDRVPLLIKLLLNPKSESFKK